MHNMLCMHCLLLIWNQGIRRDFHEALVATTGFLSQEIQVHAMRSSQAERDVVALKAQIDGNDGILQNLWYLTDRTCFNSSTDDY